MDSPEIGISTWSDIESFKVTLRLTALETPTIVYYREVMKQYILG